MNTANGNPSMVDRRSTAEIARSLGNDINSMPMPPRPAIAEPSTMHNMDETQRLLTLAAETVERIFGHGNSELIKVEKMVHEARAALELKRDAVNRSMKEFIEAMKVVQDTTASTGKAISDMIVQNDAIGH